MFDWIWNSRCYAFISQYDGSCDCNLYQGPSNHHADLGNESEGSQLVDFVMFSDCSFVGF